MWIYICFYIVLHVCLHLVVFVFVVLFVCILSTHFLHVVYIVLHFVYRFPHVFHICVCICLHLFYMFSTFVSTFERLSSGAAPDLWRRRGRTGSQAPTPAAPAERRRLRRDWRLVDHCSQKNTKTHNNDNTKHNNKNATTTNIKTKPPQQKRAPASLQPHSGSPLHQQKTVKFKIRAISNILLIQIYLTFNSSSIKFV